MTVRRHSEAVHLRLSGDLLARIDAAAKDLDPEDFDGRGLRSRLIRRALAHYLEELDKPRPRGRRTPTATPRRKAQEKA